MKILLLALFGVCWAGPTVVEYRQDALSLFKNRDIFQDPFSEELIYFINNESGAKWKVKEQTHLKMKCA